MRHLDTARVEAEQGTSEKVDKIEKYEKVSIINVKKGLKSSFSYEKVSGGGWVLIKSYEFKKYI